ncbi:unnamed protein product [Schistosoma margrebowiei]|uniref:Rab-GAP TBC domain-containing protein n=1 Tax=Schistosoma margrebowiei TaxID=48269 RepID=A0AA84Z9T0_9TREM|nr:unnamed protein product [Schistosoma margrebowiei]
MECKRQSELELLAKLEEKNRALFSDAKVVPSLHTRRREGSLSSSISTGSGQDDTRSNGTSSLQLNGHATHGSSKSSNTSGVSIPLMIGWTAGAPISSSIREQWDYVINNWDQCSKKKSYVSDLIKKGVPDEFRPLIWQLYCGAYDSAVKKHYHNYLLVNSPVEKAIRRDIARTFPKHDLFKDENGCGQESLFRVIKAYSIHDPEVGYCQGSAFIVGLLLMQMPELNAFAVLVQLMNDYRLREMYKPSMMELGVCMYQLEQLIADNLPELYTHFRTQSFAPSLYASAWFLTLFSTILPIPCATRVMDFYIVEGLQFIFKLALSILKFSADNLLRCDMESMVAFLQHEGPLAWDKHSSTIFENACSLKLNTKKMKKLAKEYMTMRSQEREEQIELRRLRTENGLLLQRLARLEEESGVMADRLVKCQLIRAQEAETTIALRCELSILRREYANLNSNSNLITNEFLLNNNNNKSVEDNDEQDKLLLKSTTINNDDVLPTNEQTINTTISNTNTTITNISNTNQNYTINDTVHQSLVNGFSSPTYNIQNDYTTINTTTTNNNNNHNKTCSSSSSLHEQQLNNSYDFCTLPRSRNRDYQINSGNHYNEMKNDELLSTTMNQLQTDLMNSRFNEADTKKILHELRCKLHELEESKLDQSLRSAEQIAVLKDELFGAKLRETELINQVEELKRRIDDLNSLWQAHLGKCKCVNNDTKRSSLWIGSLNSLDSHETNFKMKFSDRLLETRFVNQISSLKQQITDLTVQQELSDRRADRLDKRVTELLESRTAFQTRERELTLELKQLEQKCADIEAKRKADGVMWRSREMEFKTQLAERKQGYLQLEYQYESLLTSQRLQSKTDNHELMLRKSSLDSDKILEMTNNTNSTTEHNGSINNNNNANRFTLGSYLKFTQPNPPSDPSNSTVSTPKSTTDNKIVNYDKSYCPINGELYSMWKDLPPAVMTESIGPLEDLCLIPDDPMITSVYLNSSSSATSATTTTTTSPPSTPPSIISNNHF